MKESTKKFLRANRRNFQTKMKAWEYCAEGMRPGGAIRDILSDIGGRLVQFPRKAGWYYQLKGIEMVKFSNGFAEYWRACPEWESYYVSYNDEQALRQLADGTYQDGLRAGGAKYDTEVRQLAQLLKRGVIVVE